jgi:para-nitrobenzyl esterase
MVRIASGDIAGTGTGVRVFRGIPYAAPPVGPLRWCPPQPALPWSGVHDGSHFGPDPMQDVNPLPARRSLAPGVSEDCLTLNVWAPAEVPAGGAPVVVYFDGGGYVATSGARQRIDGNAYAQRGVVFVTANYRVGVFGYLAHPLLTAESPHRSSGNYGVLDAIATLRWVLENIAAFGGDPKRITAFGGSAGGATCAFMLTSPLAAGLIGRVILRAPSALRPMCTLAEAEEAGRSVGDDLATMRELPAAELLAQSHEAERGGLGLTIPRPLRPIVDGWVIERSDLDAYTSGTFAAVPAIVGNMSGEGGEIIAAVPTTAVAHGNESLAGRVKTVPLLREYIAATFGEAFDEAWTFYGTASDAEVPQRLADAWGDMMSNYGIRGLARALARRQPKTFRFLFAHAGAHTLDPPGHADDMTYTFGTGDFDARDRAVSDTIVAAFTNFIATGDPNGPGAPHWDPYDLARDNYLTFGGDFAQGSGWRAQQSAFAERFYRSRAPYGGTGLRTGIGV